MAAAALRCDVGAIQWSPTNGALACGGSDGRAHLLKPTGELLGRIPGDDGDDDAFPVTALAFSKGSRYLATAGESTDVVIWDLKRKSKFKTLAGHLDAVDTVVYSPGDQHVASGGRSGAVILHSPVSGLAVGEMTPDVPNPASVTSLHYNPHRRQMLASAANDGVVRLWDTGIRRLGSSLVVGDAAACRHARFSPTDPGLLAAASADGRVYLIDANAPKSSSMVGSIALGADATSVAWRGDGGALAAGAGDGRVVWIDPRMLSSDAARDAVLYTTVAHVGGGHTRVMWQNASGAVAAAGGAAAAEATTPTPMRATRPVDRDATSSPVGDCGFAPGGGLFLTPPAAAREDAPPTPTMGDKNTREGTGGDVGVGSDLDERLREESRRRVERLMSARGAGGTPEAAAAAARPRRGDDDALAVAVAGGKSAEVDFAALLREHAAEQIAETKRAIRAEVRNLHVELLRQMHEAQEQQLAMFEELRGAQRNLAREVEALRRSQQEYVRR